MPVPAPITTNGRFFPPQSALYSNRGGNLVSRKVENVMFLSNSTTSPTHECMLAAPLENLQHARWFCKIRARVWLDEDVDTLPAELHVVCACSAEILARMQNDQLAGSASLQDLTEDTVLHALKKGHTHWHRVRVAWAELRGDGLTAWCCLETVL